MTSNFSIIQQPNNTYVLKYDMGTTCYQGFIDQNIFPEELKVNYIEVVNEAIKYFLKESDKETKIVSMLQHPNSADVNYFMISFQRNDQFVKYQRFVNIELNKVVKTVNDYLFEFDQRIVCNKNTIHDLSQKNESHETEIKNLKEIIDKLTERIGKLEERPVIQSHPLQQQPILFNAGITNTVQSLPQAPAQHLINLPTPGPQEKKDISALPGNQNVSASFDLKNFNVQTSIKKKDLTLTTNPPSFFPVKTEEPKDKLQYASLFST
jgi:hypothetical protein